MKFQTKTSTLKSGKSITIRVPEASEAQALLDLKRAYIKNTSSIPMTLEEYPNDRARELQIIEDYQNKVNSLLVVAESEGELIGNIDLTGSSRSKMAHTAMIGMGIKVAWRNQGLGKVLIESAIDWAKNKSTIELLWLNVYASNELGYNLYKNTGFVVSGIIKNFFKEESGFIDKIQMYQHIKQA